LVPCAAANRIKPICCQVAQGAKVNTTNVTICCSGQGKDASKASLHCRFLSQQIVIFLWFLEAQEIELNLYVVKLPKEPRQIQQMSLFAASGQGKEASKASSHCHFLSQQLVILLWFLGPKQIELNLYVVKLPKEPRQV
jgi:hypothetical protein